MEEQTQPSPAGKESPMHEHQISAPPGLERSSLVDISNEGCRSPEQSGKKCYETPEKSSRRKAAANCFGSNGASPAAKPMTVLMSESSPVATPPVAQLRRDENSTVPGSPLSPFPQLPMPWQLQAWSQTTTGDMAVTNNLAAATAAAAAAAREHSVAASAASAAAFSWAQAAAQREGGAVDMASVMLLMQNLFQASGQPIPAAGVQQVPAAVGCEKTGVERKWVL